MVIYTISHWISTIFNQIKCGTISHPVTKIGLSLMLIATFGMSNAVSQVTPGDPGNFITTWQTDNPGASNDTEITISTEGGGYDYDVYWEDVNDDTQNGTESNITGDLTIDFSETGTYRVEITGEFPRILLPASGDEEKLLEINQWGDIAWASMRVAFRGASNLKVVADDSPDLSGVTSMVAMFQDASSITGMEGNWDWNTSNIEDMTSVFWGTEQFNGDISNWNTANVQLMESMFLQAESFNRDLENWDTGSVFNMFGMFLGASEFNGDISTWNTETVTTMSNMFNGAESFDQDINYDEVNNYWNTSNVETMERMFWGAESFNGDVSDWNTAAVTDMSDMFAGAGLFEQDISEWETGNVTDMEAMFQDAGLFNADIGDWDTGSVTNMSFMFRNTTFDRDIGGWETGNVTTMRSMFENNPFFNFDISEWDTSNVTDMRSMFRETNLFDQDISGWDTGSVTLMSSMFRESNLFDQDISGWETGNVTDMNSMFQDSNNFNQNLGDWDISNVETMSNMLNNSNFSSENYDKNLIGWASQEVQNDVNLGALGLEYCDGANARNVLTDEPNNWLIFGDELADNCEVFVDVTGVEGFRMLSIPAEVSLDEFLDPIWTQGAASSNAPTEEANVFTWDSAQAGNSSQTWQAVGDLGTTIEAGTGFLVFIYEDDQFGVDGDFPKTLSATGTEYTAGIEPALNPNNEGWTLLGNPFKTSISFENLEKSNLTDVIYVWDVNDDSGVDDTGTNDPGAGSWKTYSEVAGEGEITNGLITSFQGFFVQNNGGGISSLEFVDDAKTTGGEFLGKENSQNIVRLELKGKGMQNSAWFSFGANGAMGQVSGDALQLEPLSKNYALLAGKKDEGLFDISLLPVPNERFEIALHTEATLPGIYTLTATDVELTDGEKLYLEDRKNNVFKKLTEQMEYEFRLEGNFSKETTDPIKLVEGGPEAASINSEAHQRFYLTTNPDLSQLADSPELPDQLELDQNYPNPFNPTTVISYKLPEQSNVDLKVYDMTGRVVAELVNDQVAAGTHQVTFDASHLSSGVYVYRIQASGNLITRQLTLIK